MNLSPVTSLIIAIICLSSNLSAEESINRLFSSIKGKQAVPHDSFKTKSNGMCKFEQSFDSELISIDFPKVPSIKKKDGMLFAVAKERKIEYAFLAPIPPIAVYSEDLFLFLLSELNSSPCKVIEYNAYEENSHDVIEIISINNKNKKTQKVKAIVTDENFYLISVEFPLDKGDSSVDHFLNSFKIIN